MYRWVKSDSASVKWGMEVWSLVDKNNDFIGGVTKEKDERYAKWFTNNERGQSGSVDAAKSEVVKRVW